VNPDAVSPRFPWSGLVRLASATSLALGVLFASAGRLAWWEGWAYAAVTLVVLVLSRALVFVENPDIAAERADAAKREGVKSWDKLLMPATAIVGPLIVYVVAGLDERFSWTPEVRDDIQIVALCVLLVAGMIGTWAMLANPFFSSVVRIQMDRGHTVVVGGPYRLVRHPGYAGGILAWLATPFVFGSYWVAIPCAAVIALGIVRTSLEDRVLRAELPRYDAYAERVRFRLVPGVW
jgi:protein-S-isoprenylcysteine O-methyltransferase Ste14